MEGNMPREEAEGIERKRSMQAYSINGPGGVFSHITQKGDNPHSQKGGMHQDPRDRVSEQGNLAEVMAKKNKKKQKHWEKKIVLVGGWLVRSA